MRSRAAAGLLLLALTAHAFVASATHFHRVAGAGTQPAGVTLLGQERDGQGAPLAGDDAQCLLCRLQRDFVSELRGAPVSLAPPAAGAVVYASHANASARASRPLLPPGRAPPAA